MTFIVCPQCRGDLARQHDSFECRACAKSYPVREEIPQFDEPAVRTGAGEATESNDGGGSRDQRRGYWDRGWQARFMSDHAFLNELRTRADWVAYLEREKEILGKDRHVSVIEASRGTIQGKVLLDIGCGAGTSGAMFGYSGAQYIGLDHSPHAAMYTLRHLRAVRGEGFTLQSNAEALPLRDGCIDVVYSNGVLHHTPNFSTAMDEAYRVLKPGGRAIVALYATYSTQFGLVRALGALKGNLTRHSMNRWMGEASEGAWRTGGRLNPWTKTFSKAQMREVARRYEVSDLTIRKNGHPIGEFPYLGRRLTKFQFVKKVDRALEPLFGSMLIMSFIKGVGRR